MLIALSLIHIPASASVAGRRLGLPAALTLTGGLSAVVFAISAGGRNGWTSSTTIGSLCAGAVLLALFAILERRSVSPLMPLAIFRRKTFTTTIIVAALVWGCFFALIFEVTFFLQQALGYSPLETGLATLVIAVASVIAAARIAPRVADRVGAGATLAIGQACSAAGLLVLARVPVNASYATDLLPAFVMLGIGIGFSELGAQMGAFIGIDPAIAGVAGGVLETSREIGAALATAVIASIVVARVNEVSSSLAHNSAGKAPALTDGFHTGMLLLAGATAISAAISLLVLRRAERAAATSTSLETTLPPLTEPHPVCAHESKPPEPSSIESTQAHPAHS